MNVKNLAIVVGALAVISTLVAIFDRPATAPDPDPRIGQSLLDSVIAGSAQSLTITRNGQPVSLTRQTDGNWIVASYHDLPADFDKLRRLIGDLTTAKITRVVTRLPERIKRLGFGDTTLRIEGSNHASFNVDFGKTSDRGGRYARFDQSSDSPAYLTDLTAFIDSTPKNWATSDLVTVDSKDIASISLTFADESSVTAQRENADAAWTNANSIDTREINSTPINSLLSSLTSLRFTDTATPDSPDVIAARENSRTATLKTFSGETLTIDLGRRPEEVLPTPASDAPSAEDTPPEPETIPAGPVYVKITAPTDLAPLADRDQLAFQIAEYTFTSLPQEANALFKTPPVPPAPPPAAP